MENSVSRVLIETVVKKALRDVRNSPRRSIRNLVDMALHFSGGRFQHNFFEIAQTMLQNEHSPYYGLIEDTVAHVDAERLFRFGMNVGYNGCTEGAATIREIEENERYNIPWMMFLHLDAQQLSEHYGQYQSLISQGEALGIHTWMLFPESRTQELLPLAREHPDSAFALFCEPEAVTPQFVDNVRELDNLMPVVRYGGGAAGACGQLREAELLYSVYIRYTQDDVPAIAEGALFEGTQQLHPVFSVLLAAPGCTDAARKAAYEAVKSARSRQLFQTVAWEAVCDSSFVDSVISSEPCLATVDPQGCLVSPRKIGARGSLNVLQNDLTCVLKRAFPKAGAPA